MCPQAEREAAPAFRLRAPALAGQDGFAVQRPLARQAAPGMDAGRWRELQDQARHYIELFEHVDQTLAGRMRLLRYVCEVFRAPSEQWGAALAGLRADHAEMVGGILRQLQLDPGLGRRLRIALERHEAAAHAVQEARALVELENPFEAQSIQAVLAMLQRLGGSAANRRRDLVQSFELRQLKTRIFLLTTLDLLFKQDPILQHMFPLLPREQRTFERPARERAVADTRPAVPTERPIETLPEPPPPWARLKDLVRRWLPPEPPVP